MGNFASSNLETIKTRMHFHSRERERVKNEDEIMRGSMDYCGLKNYGRMA